jgi:hypothetical protein
MVDRMERASGGAVPQFHILEICGYNRRHGVPPFGPRQWLFEFWGGFYFRCVSWLTCVPAEIV